MCHRPCTILTCIEIFTLHVYHLTTLGGGGSDGGWWVTALQVCVSKFVSVALLDLPKAKSGHFPNTFAATETGHISWEVRLSPSMAGDPGTIFNPNRVIFRGGRAICSHTCGKKQVFLQKTRGHFQPCSWRQNRAGDLGLFQLWLWSPKQVFSDKTWCFPNQYQLCFFCPHHNRGQAQHCDRNWTLPRSIS